jgi:FAD/FMN-containing dehydrogenase
MPGGNVGPELIVDLTGLDHVAPVSSESAGSTAGELTAGAGAVAQRLRTAAQESGWDLPALPSSARWCTLGGMLACDAAGARSFRHGTARTWVREVEWVRADGRVERLVRGQPSAPEWDALARRLRSHLPTPLPWPRVRKNSSGYALDAFLATGDPVDLTVGSEGTLGLITEATLELARPPECRAVVLVGIPDFDRLESVAMAVDSIAPVVACEYFGRRLVELGDLRSQARLRGLALDRGMVLVEVAGSRTHVSTARREVEELAGDGGYVTADEPRGMEELWGFRHAASPTIGRALADGRRSTQFIEDSVVPVERLGDYLHGLEEILARNETDAVIFGHAGDGNLHVNPLVDLLHSGWRDRVERILLATVELVANLGGTLAGEHGDGRLRTPFLQRIFGADVAEAFRVVKHTLDPDGILNPGVKVPVPEVEPLAGLGAAPAFASGSQGPERKERAH